MECSMEAGRGSMLGQCLGKMLQHRLQQKWCWGGIGADTSSARRAGADPVRAAQRSSLKAIPDHRQEGVDQAASHVKNMASVLEAMWTHLAPLWWSEPGRANHIIHLLFGASCSWLTPQFQTVEVQSYP